VKLEQALKQIEKRIADLQRKADWIKLQLKPIPDAVVESVNNEEEALIEQPRRRGRKKLNETE